jgi:hypothetical protein
MYNENAAPSSDESNLQQLTRSTWADVHLEFLVHLPPPDCVPKSVRRVGMLDAMGCGTHGKIDRSFKVIFHADARQGNFQLRWASD